MAIRSRVASDYQRCDKLLGKALGSPSSLALERTGPTYVEGLEHREDNMQTYVDERIRAPVVIKR